MARNTDVPTARIANYSRETYDQDYGQYGHEDPAEAVHSDSEKIVFADAQGDAHQRWASDLGLDTKTVRDWMHDHLDGVDYDWISSDPIVLLKPTDAEEGDDQ